MHGTAPAASLSCTQTSMALQHKAGPCSATERDDCLLLGKPLDDKRTLRYSPFCPPVWQLQRCRGRCCAWTSPEAGSAAHPAMLALLVRRRAGLGHARDEAPLPLGQALERLGHGRILRQGLLVLGLHASSHSPHLTSMPPDPAHTQPARHQPLCQLPGRSAVRQHAPAVFGRPHPKPGCAALSQAAAGARERTRGGRTNSIRAFWLVISSYSGSQWPSQRAYLAMGPWGVCLGPAPGACLTGESWGKRVPAHSTADPQVMCA